MQNFFLRKTGILYIFHLNTFGKGLQFAFYIRKLTILTSSESNFTNNSNYHPQTFLFFALHNKIRLYHQHVISSYYNVIIHFYTGRCQCTYKNVSYNLRGY